VIALLVILAAIGADGELPPGQEHVTGSSFPVFSFAGDQHLETDEWSLTLFGAVSEDTVLAWEEFQNLPMEEMVLDFHCVTGWSRLQDTWVGVPCRAIVDLIDLEPSVTAVMVHCADGYTTNLKLEDLTAEGVILAVEFNGESITDEHGYPVRLVVPHLYAYKSAKWVTGIEFLLEEEPGYWEDNGYHMRGDPWREERYFR
jgi:DMSO/TMAO reductase YedYZ molybdopterin-dependent catalytic subunit